MLTGKAFEMTTMVLSLCVVCAAYLLVVWKDQSWINWATPTLFFTLGGRYIFQFAHLLLINADGSHYAYFFCYVTYALSFLTGALVYAFVKPIRLKLFSGPVQNVGAWPWVLLAVGFLLYLPILIEFRAYLSNPREIYRLTRTGYGVWSYGSTTFANLAFITYLFHRRKKVLASLTFYAVVGALTYWHGSKGLILAYALIWMLHKVYAERKRVGAVAAIAVLSAAGGLVLGTFALFQSTADLAELLTSITGYADYVRNAMLIMDDPGETRYYGRLTLETEVYSRVPRVLMPGKPTDFGALLLAKIYYPGSYRANAGVPAFDIGVQYADFGTVSMVLLCLASGFTAWLLATAVSCLHRSEEPGVFIVFLHLTGVSIIVAGAASYLPEVLLLATALTLVLRLRLLRGASLFRVTPYAAIGSRLREDV